MRRREVLAMLAAAGVKAGVPEYDKPVLDLKQHFPEPVTIRSIELLRNGKTFLVRATANNGVTGIIRTKQVESFVPIFYRDVVPHFIVKDARDLESLMDKAYIANYKMIGQAFWCPMAFVEQSLLDMLGRVAKKPVAELLGGVIRREIPVYLSGSGRETTAEEEVDIYVKAAQISGAKAVKFKIGGRMSRNDDAYPGRTDTLLKLARKKLGDKMVLYADANGSYDAEMGIVIGKNMQDLNYSFFEEPCQWEDYTSTKQVADALKMPVAGGECDHRLWGYNHMISTKTLDIVQPDLNYNGGFIRTMKVSRMAKAAGIPITPHNTQTDASGANILQFAAAISNTGPFMEFPFRGEEIKDNWYSPRFVIRNGVIPFPTGPGMGVEYDPAFVQKCEVVR